MQRLCLKADCILHQQQEQQTTTVKVALFTLSIRAMHIAAEAMGAFTSVV